VAVVGRPVAAATVPHSWSMSSTHIIHAAVGHGTLRPMPVRARRSGRWGLLGWRAEWLPPSPAAPGTPQTTWAAEAYRQLGIAISCAAGSIADIGAPQPASRGVGFSEWSWRVHVPPPVAAGKWLAPTPAAAADVRPPYRRAAVYGGRRGRLAPLLKDADRRLRGKKGTLSLPPPRLQSVRRSGVKSSHCG